MNVAPQHPTPKYKVPKTIILAGGKGLRWQASVRQRQPDGSEADALLVVNNKLMVEVDGKPLLQRSLSILRELEIPDPVVYGEVPGLPSSVERFIAKNPPAEVVGAIKACEPIWRDACEVCVLLGDVVWAPGAMDRVFAPSGHDWTFYGKLGANVFTGKAWPEIYAFRFRTVAADQVLEAADYLLRTLVWRRKFWELYRLLLGLPVPANTPDQGELFYPPSSGSFVVVPDWTDDIDTLEEYLRLSKLLAQARGPQSQYSQTKVAS